MAIGHISYLDLDPKQRKLAAQRTRSQIRSMMTGNFITPEQSIYLQERLSLLDKWEHGLIPISAPVTEISVQVRAPQNHTVELTETVPVDGDL